MSNAIRQKGKGIHCTTPHASVVNLGAGFDTEFCRVDNGRIRWYDLDLPEVIKNGTVWKYGGIILALRKKGRQCVI